MPWLYLDNNATTQPAAPVAAAMREVNETLWANPSSVHRFGQTVRQRIELARAAVAKLINCRDRELIFTSGGTESNNLALRGTLDAFRSGHDAATEAIKPLFITTGIEHSAIRQPTSLFAEQGVEVALLPVDRDGVVHPQTLEKMLHERATGRAVLVSIQWANNETGVIQSIAELAEVIKTLNQSPAGTPSGAKSRAVFHVDATQAVGKVSVDVKAVGVDLLTLSAHKFHGPKGTGALYVRTGVRIKPQNLGGPQERDRRGGTENTAGIIGMGVAAELAQVFLEDELLIARLTSLRDRFESAIVAELPGAVINSHGAPRLWNTTNIGFPRLEAEAVLLGLSEKNLCASAGAACSSGSLEPSPVLLAMGIPEEIAHGSVRYSISRFTTEEEIEQAIAIVPAVVKRLAKTLPAGV